MSSSSRFDNCFASPQLATSGRALSSQDESSRRRTCASGKRSGNNDGTARWIARPGTYLRMTITPDFPPEASHGCNPSKSARSCLASCASTSGKIMKTCLRSRDSAPSSRSDHPQRRHNVVRLTPAHASVSLSQRSDRRWRRSDLMSGYRACAAVRSTSLLRPRRVPLMEDPASFSSLRCAETAPLADNRIRVPAGMHWASASATERAPCDGPGA